jgi:large subunit ribosomal protein L14
MQQESKVFIIDNSGARKAAVIRISKLEALIRITKVYPAKKIKKGQLFFAVITAKKALTLRLTGVNVKSFNNEALLLKKDKSPLGTRVYRPIFLEFRHLGMSKLCSIAKSVY